MTRSSLEQVQAASDVFLQYLQHRYRERLDEELDPRHFLVCGRDEDGEWEVFLPKNLYEFDDDYIRDAILLLEVNVRTRGDLIRFMQSQEWQDALRDME